jgi:hypothetical protein
MRKAGRSVVIVQEGGVICPDPMDPTQGRLRFVLLDLMGATAVPACSVAPCGTSPDLRIAEWVFDAGLQAAGSFPLTLTVNEARYGAEVRAIQTQDGALSFGLPTMTPTPIATPTRTPKLLNSSITVRSGHSDISVRGKRLPGLEN